MRLDSSDPTDHPRQASWPAMKRWNVAGSSAPTIESVGRSFPVDVRWLPMMKGTRVEQATGDAESVRLRAIGEAAHAKGALFIVDVDAPGLERAGEIDGWVVGRLGAGAPGVISVS